MLAPDLRQRIVRLPLICNKISHMLPLICDKKIALLPLICDKKDVSLPMNSNK